MKFERHHEILKRLSKFGSVKVSDLSNSLNVTKETIRSDLNELARLGYLTRCHGGAFIVLDSLETIAKNECSCPLISRQGLYLKLTLPADVDILAESDNPTHYADGFHCNARSPLQGYAMPFLHSVSA